MDNRSADHDRAVFLCQANRELSRQNFLERVSRAADGFAKMGLRAGDTVAILMRNDIAFLEASLAAKAAGGVAVPINWHSTAPEITYILDDCRAQVIVGHSDLLASAGHAALPVERVLAVRSPSDVVAAYGLDPARAEIRPWMIEWDRWLMEHDVGDASFALRSDSMLYTSGTTGRPKGVRRHVPTRDQQQLIEGTRKSIYGVKPGARTLVPGPLYHGAPNGIAIHAAQVADSVILMERFDPEQLLHLIEKYRIDTIFMVPTMFNRLLKLEQSVRQNYDLSSLKFVLHAAAPCPVDLKRRMIEWWGPIIHEFYGGTESGPCAFCSSEQWLRYPGTVGKVVDNATLRVMDAHGNECATGEPGEIYMRLHHYPDFTYNGLDDKRREIERDGLITLGDIGYMNAEGYLFLCDRKRDMVIIGGANVYPAEIESVLLGMPGVRDCAVFGVPDEDYGERLLALVEPHDDTSLAVSDIQGFLKGRLNGFKLPRRIEIRRNLPREDSGKILKRVLRAPYWDGTGRQV